MTRNIDNITLKNASNAFGFLVYKDQDYIFDSLNPTWPTGKRSIITIGNDIILNTSNDIAYDVTNAAPKALIALKDTQ